VNTYQQHALRFRGAETFLRYVAQGLMFTVAAAVEISLGTATARAQVLDLESPRAQLRTISTDSDGVETIGTGNVHVTVKPSDLNFPFQLVGTTSAGETVTFTNHGNVDVYFTSIVLDGVSSNDFTFTTTCGINGNPLAPGASCTATVYFTPIFSGGDNVVLFFSGNFIRQQVSIAGQGTAVVIKPKSLTFPKTTVGSTSAPKTVIFENVGSTALPITSFSWSGKYFTQTNTCGTSVAANSSCKISITFSPLTAGTFTATLSIGDPDPTGPQKIAVTGVGVAAGDVQ
jgi:hypothetical protein